MKIEFNKTVTRDIFFATLLPVITFQKHQVWENIYYEIRFAFFIYMISIEWKKCL